MVTSVEPDAAAAMRSPIDADPQFPDIDPRYEILCSRGAGGQGVVYKARHVALNQHRALKLLDTSVASDPSFLDRFRIEGQVMAKFRHPHIVPVHDLVLRDGHPYCLVLDYIDGPNLGEYLRVNGPLAVADAVEVARQLAGALAHAHRRRVLHRDVKPRNILIRSDRPWHVLLTDFGIAKVQDGEELTRPSTCVGTLRYSAPEQLGYAPTIDQRADIFALGLVLFEMVEGRRFFDHPDDSDILAWVFGTRTTPISFARSMPADLRSLITSMLSRDPLQRPQGMQAVLVALTGCLSSLGSTPDGPAPLETQEQVADATDEQLEEEIDRLVRERERRRPPRSHGQAAAAPVHGEDTALLPTPRTATRWRPTTRMVLVAAAIVFASSFAASRLVSSGRVAAGAPHALTL